MITSIQIENFRCFKDLKINDCHLVNIIVGDNGSGKTALLEGIFFALGHSPALGLRFRQHRGLAGSFSGSTSGIVEAIWKDFFYARDWNQETTIKLDGDGPEARSVTLTRRQSQQSIPLSFDTEKEEPSASPVQVIWRDSAGIEHIHAPKVTQKGLEFETSSEIVPDFFLFSANQQVGAAENVERFSALSRKGKLTDFVKIWAQEFPWIENLSIEVEGGAPAIYASLRGQKEKLPLPNVSGAINRMVGVFLAMSSRDRAIVLVDEIENGIYYRHQVAIWRALLATARAYSTQIFMSTHSEEWLEALAEAAGDKFDDVSLWRMERSERGPEIHRFSGKKVIAGIKAGEVR